MPPSPITILDAQRKPITVDAPQGFGRRTAAESKSIVYSSEDLAAITAIRAKTEGPIYTFARPGNTTQYSLYDGVLPASYAAQQWNLTNDQGGRLFGAIMRKTGLSVVNAYFRQHVFTSDPGCTSGDNNLLVPASILTWIGAIDINFELAGGNGAASAGGPIGNKAFIKIPTGITRLYGLIESRGNYAPASAAGGSGESITVELDTDMN